MNPDRKDPSDFEANPVFPDEERKIDSAAARWIERRDAGLSPAETDELQAWLAADRRHASALGRKDLKRTEFDWPWYSGTVGQVLSEIETRERRRRRRKLAGMGSVAAALALGLIWQVWRGVAAPSEISRTMTVVEPRHQVLPDGSVVDLKDGAEISSDFSGRLRLVSLSRGAAHFKVTKNPERPFVVSAAGVAVRAVGTAFEVELGSSEVSVLVTEGRVAVYQASPGPAGEPTAAPPLAVVGAGSGIALKVSPESGRKAVVQPVLESEMTDRLAWRMPLLEFSGTPLGEVIAKMNRYNRLRFVIADPSLAELRLSGMLRADKVDALEQLLETDFGLKAERRGDSEIVLSKGR